MHTLAITAAEALIWSGVAVAVIGAIASGAVSIIAALNAKKTEGKTEAQAQRLNATDERLNMHGEQITKLAENQPPPGTTTPTPPTP